MCAKYGSAAEYNLLEKTYKVSFPQIHVLPNEIIFPHKIAPVIVAGAESVKSAESTEIPLQLKLMNYSLIPNWSKVKKPKFATYNARLEEVLNKPSWQGPFKSKHCLVPILNFYESVYTGDFAGHNIKIEAKDHHVLTAAGIWDVWKDSASGQNIESFAIITTEPPEDILAAGHDRCPLFLKPEVQRQWLQKNKSGEDWVDFLLKNKEAVPFGFTKQQPLKNYTGQLSLFEDE